MALSHLTDLAFILPANNTRKGSIKVQIKKNDGKISSVWTMHTTNIRRLGFAGHPSLMQRRGQISRVVIDDDVFELDKGGVSIGGVMLTDGVFVKNQGNKGGRKWTVGQKRTKKLAKELSILDKNLQSALNTFISPSPPS